MSAVFQMKSGALLLKKGLLIGSAAAVLALAGCASQPTSGQVYREGEALKAQRIEMGTVETVRQVTIQGTNSGVGGAAGSIIGGIAGSNVGKGRGAAVGTVIGAVAGGVLGKMTEDEVVQRPGLEITVQLDDGSMRAFVQDADVAFSAGQRVRIVSVDGKSRVTP